MGSTKVTFSGPITLRVPWPSGSATHPLVLKDDPTKRAESYGRSISMVRTKPHHCGEEMVPISQCSFSRTQLDVRINDATLTDGALHAARYRHLMFSNGRCATRAMNRHCCCCPNHCTSAGSEGKVPVGTPNADYTGTLTVDGCEIPIDGWRGSQNHNWGSRHTDRYAWGQVAGFDNAPDAFLECCTAQVKIGPVWSPTPDIRCIARRETGDRAQRSPAGRACVREIRFSPGQLIHEALMPTSMGAFMLPLLSLSAEL